MPENLAPRTAFVLGGGGKLGGYQVGMLRALLERDITPDLVFGASVGSLQGALLAANATPTVCDTLTELWEELLGRRVMSVTARGLFVNAVRRRPALASQDALQEVAESYLGAATRIEDLPLPYQCVAASVERAAARYFDSGPLVPAVLASCAVPGLWPPVRVGIEHYIDGGVVETVPVSRAVTYGATTVYVLRMRQREQPLSPARWPWQIGSTVFEVARRHRLAQILNVRLPGVRVHILPSGEAEGAAAENPVRARPSEEIAVMRRRIVEGYHATCQYLDAVAQGHSPPLASSANPVARSYLTTVGQAGRTPPQGTVHGGATTPYVAAKHRALFRVFDHEGNGLIVEADWLRRCDGILTAFGHAPGSRKAAQLTDAFDSCWRQLCAAVGAKPTSQLDRDAFEGGMAELAGSIPAYGAHVLPMVVALLKTADSNSDNMLDVTEAQRLLRAFGVPPADALAVARRMDTNGDGGISLDELNEAFRDYFTSEERGCVGNLLFGPLLD
ncbi:patatin-like phospholipase family protein [Streptomyces sp. NPDC006879]|uniref:patatin-like phospholipase family protein n=1 Tax=Streptomyces sp. NPDC006879 TaxID=3364767 RepID=UPI0036BDF704